MPIKTSTRQHAAPALGILEEEGSTCHAKSTAQGRALRDERRLLSARWAPGEPLSPHLLPTAGNGRVRAERQSPIERVRKLCVKPRGDEALRPAPHCALRKRITRTTADVSGGMHNARKESTRTEKPGERRQSRNSQRTWSCPEEYR